MIFLTIFYPANTLTQLAFLNREWTIGRSNRGYIVLTAADGDEVQLISRMQKSDQ